MSRTPSLRETFGYSELLSYYETNKDRPWQEWLSFETVFAKRGKQGVVGLLNLKEDKEGRKYVFKVSRYIDHLIQHESVVAGGLNEMAPYCPHFCKSVGSIVCSVNASGRKQDNPFDAAARRRIEKEVLLYEFIDESSKFYNYIRAVDKVPEDILYSTVKQVLLAVAVAQKKKKFTHYDLHSFNVMMRKCNKDVVFLYVLDKDHQFAVPTLGHYPVIIDFGFSYISDMEDNPLWAGLAHTDIGFTSDRFDWVADPKLFLVTVSKEIKGKRGGERSHKLRRVTKNLFGPLDINWFSGWDEGGGRSAADHVADLLRDHNPGSQLFRDYEHYCVDLIQSMIVLPLKRRNYSNVQKPFSVFVKEWLKLENQISSPFYNLYILKGVVDAARRVRAEYVPQDGRVVDAVRAFRRCIQDRVDEVAKFCRLNSMDYEKMLCSLLVLSKCIEGILYDAVSARAADKNREYGRLPLHSIEQVYSVVEANIPDRYTFNKNTTVFVLDAHKEACGAFRVPEEELDAVNKAHPLARGAYLYNLYGSGASAPADALAPPPSTPPAH